MRVMGSWGRRLKAFTERKERRNGGRERGREGEREMKQAADSYPRRPLCVRSNGATQISTKVEACCGSYLHNLLAV